MVKPNAQNVHQKQCLIFSIDKQEYGIDILKIDEVLEQTHITPIPNAPVPICGVINVRADIVGVFDLRKQVQSTTKSSANHSIIIIVRGKEGRMGMLVDAVANIIELDAECEQLKENHIKAVNHQYVEAAYTYKNKEMLLLNIDVLCEHVVNEGYQTE